MVKQTLIAFLIIPICGFFVPIFGQKAVTIKLNNPSFEDYPSPAYIPKEWFSCNFVDETPPDTHPSGSFGVNKAAFDGDTYLGMVVRDNDTWEAVGQKLKSKLFKDTAYSFSVYACRSKSYDSRSRKTYKEVRYTTPVVIRICGGNDPCSKLDILAESKLITSYEWEKIDFILRGKVDYSYLVINVFYKNQATVSYNGNILVDNLSDIVPISDKN